MIFPILLLFGLGAFAAYELVPRVRSWTDDHAKHIEDAILAHQVADQHLQSSQAAQVAIADHVQATGGSAPSWISQMWGDAIQHAQAAGVANQVAASKTVDATKAAKTDQQVQVAAQSAAAVDDRKAKIEALKQQLGVGQCDMRTYKKVSARVKDALIAKLKSEGMDVSGAGVNQWEINTHKGAPGVDVRLRAAWDPSTETLYLIVLSGKVPFLVDCDDIWGRLEPKLKGIIGN